MADSNEDMLALLERCKSAPELTAWESDFIKSVLRQHKQKGDLSSKQWAIVRKIGQSLIKDGYSITEEGEAEDEPAPLDAVYSRPNNQSRSFGDNFDGDIPF